MTESLKDILKRLPPLPAPTPSEVSALQDTPGEVCPVCQSTGYLVKRDRDPNGLLRGSIAIPCECSMRETMLCYLESLPNCTFSNFERLGFERAYDAAWSLAEGLSDKPWLVLLGKPGLGKTHLAVAILRQRANKGQAGRFEGVPDLLGWLRQGIGQEFDSEERLESVKSAPFLVLDDLGREKGTEWAEQVIYQVVDYRYRKRLETIVTSNLPLSGLAEPVRDRLEDKRLAEVVLLQGVSYRQTRPADPSTTGRGRERCEAGGAGREGKAPRPKPGGLLA